MATGQPVQSQASSEAAAGVHVEVAATITAPTPPDSRVKKIIVAVHGVGDQYTYATLQAVVNQFCAFYRQPAGVPLGKFHNGTATFLLPDPYPRDPFERLAFAEVYWARIPRTIVDEKHTLEEAKKWAQTIVERLRLRWQSKQAKGEWQERDFRLVKQVLAEMIQTVAVLDRIGYLAERAGLFSFDLRKLLDDYLGDVQIVTEFDTKKVEILGSFQETLDKAHTAFPGAEIYILSHSEGTVISFLGLLDAFRQETPASWAGSVRGFMTLGSPIDKHLLLWPELFGDTAPRHSPARPIEWHNYYDNGDPIGFDLDDARKWIELRGWTGVFGFDARNDYGFSRYPFPGKAHVDYWTDEAVFKHFITNVVKEPEASAPVPSVPPPTDHQLNKLFSYVAPYFGVVALLFVAVYVLYRALVEAIPEADKILKDAWFIPVAVARLTLVLLGVTVAARIPRLTRNTWLRVAAVVFALGACVVYYATPLPDNFSLIPRLSGVQPGITTPILAMGIVGLAYAIGSLRPAWGAAPLMLAGGVVVGAVIVANIIGRPTDAIWPVFVATAAFLYIWWLATLILDLIVVWHWYIRHRQVLTNMDRILGGENRYSATPASSGGRTAPTLAPQVDYRY